MLLWALAMKKPTGRSSPAGTASLTCGNRSNGAGRAIRASCRAS